MTYNIILAFRVGKAAPIACTLDNDDFKAGIDRIAELNARVLVAVHRNDLCHELDYTPFAVADVRQTMDQERKCCES